MSKTKTGTIILAWLASVTLVITACGAKKNYGDRIGNRMAPSLDSDDANPDELPGDSITGPNSGDATSADGAEDAEYKKLLKSCGGIDPAYPDRLSLNQALKGIPARQVGTETIVLLPVNYKVDFDGDLTIRSAISGNDSNQILNLINAQPNIATGMAKTRLAAKSGTLRTDYLSYSERATMADIDPVWEGVTCTIQPGYKTTTTVGSRVVATYDKPLPIHISPIADRERYELEIDRPRHWELKATIRESANSALKVGQIINGSVDIERVSGSQQITKIDGTTVSISSDTGIKVSIKFGTDAITNMIGLTPETTYLIDHTTHLFHAITANIKDGETPLVTFITPGAMP